LPDLRHPAADPLCRAGLVLRARSSDIQVSHVQGEVKQAGEVFRGDGRNFFDRCSAYGSECGRGVRNPAGLVALSTIWDGGEERGVGFDEEVVFRDLGGYVAEGLGFGIGEMAGEADEEAGGDGALGVLPFAGEAVEDAADAGRGPVFFEEGEGVVPAGVVIIFRTAMDEDGTLAGGGYFHLADEDALLGLVVGALMVVVEADLATGDHFGLLEKLVELVEGGLVGFMGVVGVDAGACEELRQTFSSRTIGAVEAAAYCESLMHFGGAFADADREDGADASFACAAKNGFKAAGFEVAGVTVAVQMSVGVYEQQVFLQFNELGLLKG